MAGKQASSGKKIVTNRRPVGGAFLRWAGSKRKLLPRLLAKAPEHFDRYIEPFAGSACLFFALRPEEAVLGDINKELIGTYVEIRDRVEEVIERLTHLHRSESRYYEMRVINPDTLPSSDRAVRFIYLNRFCFNGLYRTNLQGQFNVPYGGSRSGQIPSAEFLRECAVALRGVTLMAASFEDTLSIVRQGDFVYLDPPYCIRSRRVFNEYSNAAFGSEQLRALRGHLDRLDQMGVEFLVSYGHSSEALELGRGFNCRQMVVQRQIAGFATDRRKSREVLITNF